MFALLYGRVSCVRMEFDGQHATSNVERTIEETQRLRELGMQVCGTCLQGFLFFGTANSILQRVRERLNLNTRASDAGALCRARLRRDQRDGCVGIGRVS